MLKSFSVQNFCPFERLHWDFSRKRDYAFSRACLARDASAVKTALVYGAGASGKSRLGRALFDVKRLLTGPGADAFLPCAGHPDEPARFTYGFSLQGKEISYAYARDKTGKLTEEELLCNGCLVFQWSALKGTRDFSRLQDFGFSALNPDGCIAGASFLRYAASQAKLDELSPVMLVMDFVKGMLWMGDHEMLASPMDELIIQKKLLKPLEDFLHEYGMKDTLTEVQLPDGKKAVCLMRREPIPFFSTASMGTLALARFFFGSRHFREAGFLFMDDFDAFYEVKVSERIYNLMKNQDFQSVLTTQRTHLLTHALTRPDCVFKIQNGKIRSLADLTDREIREGNNLEKLYLAGEFDE